MNYSLEIIKVAKLLNSAKWNTTKTKNDDNLEGWRNEETDEYRYQKDKPEPRKDKKVDNRRNEIKSESMDTLSKVFGIHTVNEFLNVAAEKNVRSDRLSNNIDNFVALANESENHDEYMKDFEEVIETGDIDKFMDKY